MQAMVQGSGSNVPIQHQDAQTSVPSMQMRMQQRAHIAHANWWHPILQQRDSVMTINWECTRKRIDAKTIKAKPKETKPKIATLACIKGG